MLAPMFMIGGALGALEGSVLPHVAPGFWAMCGLAAVLGGVMRSPLTGVVFTVELTHQWGALLALLLASTAAYALSVLVLRRSVLTEKIARRGLHLTREYSTDPLETFFVRDVMHPSGALTADAALQVSPDTTLRHLAYLFAEEGAASARVVEADGRTVGLVGIADLLQARLHDLTEEHHRARTLLAGDARSGRATRGA